MIKCITPISVYETAPGAMRCLAMKQFGTNKTHLRVWVVKVNRCERAVKFMAGCDWCKC
jgi:hypothetical protein